MICTLSEWFRLLIVWSICCWEPMWCWRLLPTRCLLRTASRHNAIGGRRHLLAKLYLSLLVACLARKVVLDVEVEKWYANQLHGIQGTSMSCPQMFSPDSNRNQWHPGIAPVIHQGSSGKGLTRSSWEKVKHWEWLEDLVSINNRRASHTGDALKVMYSSASVVFVHVLGACAQVQSTVCQYDVLFTPQLVTHLFVAC